MSNTNTTSGRLAIRAADLIAAADALRPLDFNAALRLRCAGRILSETELGGIPCITPLVEALAGCIDFMRDAVDAGVLDAQEMAENEIISYAEYALARVKGGAE